MANKKLNWTKIGYCAFFIICGIFWTALTLWTTFDNIVSMNPWYYYFGIALPGSLSVLWWIVTVRLIKEH